MARRRTKSNESGCGLLIIAALAIMVVGPGSLGNGGDGLLGLLVLVGLVVAAVWLVRRLAGPKTATAQELARRFALVSTMSGTQFERFMADLFTAMGHNTVMLGGSGDQGVDLIVNSKGQRVAVQCKNYKRAVGNKPVQEVFAGARHHGCQLAWVVAPAGYTKGAHELARSVGVLLFDANSIRQWIKLVDEAEKKRLKEQAQEVHTCWKCNSETTEEDAFCRSCGAWLRSQVQEKNRGKE
jgi:restriction system protein